MPLLGDYGDKFYVILEGLVSVLVPQKAKQKDEKSRNPPDEQYTKNINIQQMLQSATSGSVSSATGRSVKQVQKPVPAPPPPQNPEGYQGSGMYEVAKLTAGKHFGELALTTNKPRAATVKALVPT